jgi:oxepin-CoA hydrolase/3-oxo-5,6-dehydrosuberyl-CoA semialdehyde dehydrogenase
MVNKKKLQFLETGFIPLVKQIDVTASPCWGKMNTQQMIEHVAAFFKVSTNKLQFPLTTPPEHLPKFKEFLMSEKEFRENTKAPVLPPEPLPLQFGSMNEAVDELEKEVHAFTGYFADDTEKRTQHPAFGELNFEEWVQLHHKHVKHHLKQFGVEIPS